MDSGMVMEYDHPHKLIEQKDSMFFKLISKTGQQNVEKFRGIAKQVSIRYKLVRRYY